MIKRVVGVYLYIRNSNQKKFRRGIVNCSWNFGDGQSYTETTTQALDGTFVYEIVNSNLPNDPDISFNQNTGAFNWPTDCNDAGSYSLDVRAKDNDGATSAYATVTINVANDPTCSVPTN